MSSNNNFKETFLTKKGDDVTIGEDSTDTMIVNSNTEFNSQTTFNSQINMGGPIIPNINDQFDIGSAEYKVRDLYLSSNSLHIGETILSEDTETDGQGNITERNIKIKTGDGAGNEFKLAKLDANGRLPNDKMPNGLLDDSGNINKEKIDPTFTLSLNDLSNVDTDGVEEGKALVYSGDTWKPGTVATSGGASALNDLTDVSVSGASNGQSLVYNSTSGDWEPGTGTVDVNTEEYALAGAGGTADFTAYGLYGNNATDVITGTNGSAGQYHSAGTTITELPNNDITADLAINLPNSTTTVGLSYEFTTPQIVTKYRIWMHGSNSAALAKTPKNWEFRASIDKSTYNSNDSSTYTVLDSRNNVTSYPAIVGTNGNTASGNLNFANEYHLSTTGAYKYYILHVTSTNGGVIFSVSELALYGGGFVLPSQVGNAGKYLKTDGTALEWAEVSGGGTSVTAHTETQTGNEDYLSALTVDGTKYKVGTSIQNVSYSDSSKLHLSFPFQRASTSAEALVNQVSGVDATTTGTTFTSGTGFIHDSSDRTTIDINTSITLPLTIFIRYKRTANSNDYQYLFEAIENDSDTGPSNYAIRIYQDASNSNLRYQAREETGSTAFTRHDYNGYVVGRWTNACMVLDSNSNMIIYTDSSESGIMVKKGQDSPVKSNLQISKLRLGNYVTSSNPDHRDAFNGDISDFYIFKTALSAYDIQAWTNYINNDYVNPGNPAPLKYLADVSETTPTDGQALVYDETEGEWQPGTVGSTLTVKNQNTNLDTAATTLNFVGSGVTASGTDATKTITINNELTNWSEDANGHIIPELNATYDIGSAEKKVRHLYLSQNSLYMGSGTDAGTAISLDADGDLKIGDKKLLKEDANQKIPSGKLPISVTHSSNVLSTLTIGDNTYNLPSGGGGGGVSTTATIPAVLPFHNLDSDQFIKLVFRTLEVYDDGNDGTNNFDLIFDSGSNSQVVGKSFNESTISNLEIFNTTYVLDNNTTNPNPNPKAELGYNLNGSSSTLETSVPSSPYDIDTFTKDSKIHVRFFKDILGNSTYQNFYSAGTLTIDTSKLMTDYAGYWEFSIYHDQETKIEINGSVFLFKGFRDGGTPHYRSFVLTQKFINVKFLHFESVGGETVEMDFFRIKPVPELEMPDYEINGTFSTSLEDITDVSFSSAPTDGQALVYDETEGEWQPGNVAASVEAHTETQTGNEDYLSALTVDGTKYKVGTSVQQVSYSDTSKLLLSYPFSAAANATDAQTNYGSFNSSNITTDFDYYSFTANDYVTVRNDQNPINNISFKTINGNFNNSGDDFTIYLRWRKTGNVAGEDYSRLISAWVDASDSTRLQVYMHHNVDNTVGEPTNNLLMWFGDDGYNSLDLIPTITTDRWYNMIIVVNNTNSEVRAYIDRYTSGVLNVAEDFIDRSSLSNPNYVFNNISLGRYRYDSSMHEFDGDFSDFYIFNSALSVTEAQLYVNYVENRYVNPGNPAPLKYLADVSETTPLNGDSLVYSSISSQWMPQRAASQFGLPAGDNAKIWVVAGESVSRVGNYPINHIGTGRTFSYDGDGHLYLNHSNGANYLSITDSSTLMDVSTASYTFALVLDLNLNDGGNGGADFQKTHILTYDATNEHALLFYNNNNSSIRGSLGIDYHLPSGQLFLHNPASPPAGHPTLPTNYYEGKALIVVTYQYTSSTSQTVTVYKNGTQTFTHTTNDVASDSGTNTEWQIAGSSNQEHGGFQVSKFYAAAVWDRVLTTDEISQLTIEKLVSKRQTLPFYQISDKTPIDGQNLVYSSSTGQYEPKNASPTEIESQLCGGSLGTNDITPGWPRASTVYGNSNGTTYPDRLFDNIVMHQYTEQAGWSSMFDAASQYGLNQYDKVWNDSTEQYDSASNTSQYNGEDQLQMRFNQPRTITKIMMLWRSNVPFQFPKALRIFGSNSQPSAVSSHAGMNLLFQTDGTGYSEPSSITYSGTAQDNLDIAIPFVIPVAKQGAYQYYTIQIDDLWSATGTYLAIGEMFFFHKTQNYRNYQYKQFSDRQTTNISFVNSSTPQWSDITGFVNNPLSISTVENNSKIRIGCKFIGEWNHHTVEYLAVRLRKIVNGQSTYLNVPNTTLTATLGIALIGDNEYNNNHDSTPDSFDFVYIDETSHSPGTSITYIPQITNTAGSGSFTLNGTIGTSAAGTNAYHHEHSFALIEAEEILTGPPLTVNGVAISTTPMVGDSLVYDGSVWKSGFAELLQSLSRIGAGFGPPEGFINENPGNNHIRGSAPPLGQSAIYIPTEFQGNCVINNSTGGIFDNISNNMALNQVPQNTGPGPSTSVPYVLEIAIDVPKVVTNYAMYSAPNLPYATAWDFQVYDPFNAEWVSLDTKTNQNMVSSSTRPSDQTQYQEVQLCGGTSGSSAIASVIASTVYVNNSNNINPNPHYPTKLFDNLIRDYYDGWHSLSYGTTGEDHIMWSDTANGYVPITAAENDAYLQIRFTQPRMITKVLMLWRHYIPQQFPKSFSIYGSNTQPSVLRSTTGMNLLFSTDGTGYSQPPSSNTTWSGSAQNNLNSAISFVIPAANQGHYEYLTFHFTKAWSDEHDVVITEMFLFHNEDKYATASVSTSILSRLYRFSITGSSGTGTNNYIQFGEIGMTFKQPTSVTKVNVEGTPTEGDLLQYDGNIWTPLTIQPTMTVLAGEGVGNLVSTTNNGKTVDRGSFSLTVSHMYTSGGGYTANGLCDNVVSGSHPQVFTSVATSDSNTTLDIIYDFKQPILANHLKAWPNSYSTSHALIGSFVIYGSNDNSTWSSLGSQTWTSSDYGFENGTYTASEYRNLAASFDFNTVRLSYQYYKISVSSDQFGVNVSTVDTNLYIGEVALYIKGNGIQFLEEKIRNIERVLNVT